MKDASGYSRMAKIFKRVYLSEVIPHGLLAFALIFNPPVPIVKALWSRENTWRETDGLEDHAGLCHWLSR